MKKLISIILACALAAALFVPFSFAEDSKDASVCTAWGDMDGDKKITSGDARLVLRQSVGLEHYPEDALYRCDIDKDGKISSGDARFVLRLSVNLEQYPAHELLPVIGRDATCTEDGLTDGLYCAVCEQELAPQEVIPALGHREVVDEAVEATCTADGLTEGKHCEVCGEVFTAQETVPALGHDPKELPASSYDVCQQAQVCDRCGEALLPELKHEVPANATVTAENGIVCTRCGKTTIPSFNELVNVLKQEDHTFHSFAQTDTEISSPKFTGVMLLFKSAFEEEFENSMGKETEYTSLSDKTEINRDTFEVVGSDAVSLLKDADLQSTKTETVTGVDFLSELPDSYTGAYGRINDMTDIKTREFGELLKVTVVLKPERYSELNGKESAMSRISKEYDDMLNDAMREFASLNEDFLKSECDCLSTVTVVYYFDRATLAPITAKYRVDMDMDQSMSIDLSGVSTDGLTIPINLGKTGAISFKVTTDVISYCFFDSYFD